MWDATFCSTYSSLSLCVDPLFLRLVRVLGDVLWVVSKLLGMVFIDVAIFGV